MQATSISVYTIILVISTILALLLILEPGMDVVGLALVRGERGSEG